jgi:photosynthetic reaction center H subunit
MQVGAITSYIDVAQIVLYVFWIFFAGLILYLRREDKREGYPLESDRSANAPRVSVQGFPRIPAAKRFKLAHGGEATAPRAESQPEIKARAVERFPGAPLQPTGDPMTDGVGPGAYALRADAPDLTFEGHARIVPMRIAGDFTIHSRDPDPRGMSVLGADGVQAGTISDLWVDRAEPQIRYVEVVLANTRVVLVPIGFTRFDKSRRCAHVRAILAEQFSGVPSTASADQISLLEEERISAYYGAGTLYATAARAEPFL